MKKKIQKKKKKNERFTLLYSYKENENCPIRIIVSNLKLYWAKLTLTLLFFQSKLIP